MNKYHWLRLKEVEDPIKMVLQKGDKFLYGSHMIAQKDTKKIGEQITYFEVINSEKEGKNIEYVQIFEMLEEDVIDDKRN